MKKSLLVCVFCLLSISLFPEETFVIGISGGTGSGKTTLANKIHQQFFNSTLISQDSYYKDQTHLSMEERDQVNFDHPNSLEFSLLKEQLMDLKNGLPIKLPVYSFHEHARLDTTNWIEPSRIIIVEGMLLFAAEELRDLFDLKIFVDTDADVRILRRLERDIKERSRDFKSVVKQYLETVKPMHENFVEPSKKHADLIVLGEGDNQAVVDLIVRKLSKGS
jgi:uridine kinase